MTAPRGPQPFPGQEKRLRLLAFVRQDSVVRVDTRVEDTAMTWPHLLVIEFIAAMLWSLGLFIIAALFNAPLQDHSTVDCTPNPSKAPWYLLNLQELLLHMDKGLAGVVVPTLWLVFMAAIPLRHPERGKAHPAVRPRTALHPPLRRRDARMDDRDLHRLRRELPRAHHRGH